MSRVVRSNMASHCALSSQCSADSTTFRTIIRFRDSGCEELTRPSRILSIVATQQGQGQGVRSGRPQPRGGAEEPRGGGSPPPRPGAVVGVRAPGGRELKPALG
uniref:Uncharacterized protein n=1 Tax=Equus caballus TaxID=9796 RepID=A0A9L0T4S9_HORSE